MFGHQSLVSEEKYWLGNNGEGCRIASGWVQGLQLPIYQMWV